MDKAYLITRELDEQKGYTHHLNIVTAHKKKESNVNSNDNEKKKKTLIIKGHKIFTNVSTVFKNKRRKGCSSVRHVEIVQDDNCYSEAQCSVAHVWVTRPADRHTVERVSAFE